MPGLLLHLLRQRRLEPAQVFLILGKPGLPPVDLPRDGIAWNADRVAKMPECRLQLSAIYVDQIRPRRAQITKLGIDARKMARQRVARERTPDGHDTQVRGPDHTRDDDVAEAAGRIHHAAVPAAVERRHRGRVEESAGARQIPAVAAVAHLE